MLNLLRSDIYRLARQMQFWVLAAITVTLCVLGAVMLAWVSSPEFTAYVNDVAAEQMGEMSADERAVIERDLQEAAAESQALSERELPSITQTWAQEFLAGGFLGLMGSIAVVLFLTSDFRGGFVRSLVMDRRGRVRYYAEKLVLVALMQAVLLLLCAASCVAAFAAYGFTYQVGDSPADVAVWLALAWLISCAYAFITACVVWIARSEWVGTACAVLVSGGIAGGLIAALFELLSAAVPWLADATYLTLHGCVQLLSAGAGELMHPAAATLILGLPPVGDILLVTFASVAVCAAVVFGVCRKRDV